MRADRQHPSVDTRLDLAVEERRVAELRSHVQRSRTWSMALRTRSFVGSTPRSRNNWSVSWVEIQARGMNAAPPNGHPILEGPAGEPPNPPPPHGIAHAQPSRPTPRAGRA
jgi:hypothetical protein